MSSPPTLRTIHERCKARHFSQRLLDAGDWCLYCNRPHPCPDYSDAAAVLKLLDEAEAVQDGHWLNPLPVPMRFRYVPDPLPAVSSASTPPHTHKETT